MIIVDRALRAREEEGRPIRVGMLGAGFMAQGLANQVRNSVPGMEIVAIYGRRPERRSPCSATPATTTPSRWRTSTSLEDAVRAGRSVVTEDALLLCRSEQIDAIMDVTGSVELGARIALEAFEHGKHFVAMNAELDATLGPILHTHARKHGVEFSACDGDEPGLQMNLYRWVRGLGLEPRVMGNVKGLQDPYRTPETQKDFAEKWGQNPAMVTSFADGSKISFEQTIVANATGAQGAPTGDVPRQAVRRLAARAPLAVRRRRGAGARVDRRLHGRPFVREDLLPGRARGSEATPLPQPLQDG